MDILFFLFVISFNRFILNLILIKLHEKLALVLNFFINFNFIILIICKLKKLVADFIFFNILNNNHYNLANLTNFINCFNYFGSIYLGFFKLMVIILVIFFLIIKIYIHHSSLSFLNLIKMGNHFHLFLKNVILDYYTLALANYFINIEDFLAIK